MYLLLDFFNNTVVTSFDSNITEALTVAIRDIDKLKLGLFQKILFIVEGICCTCYLNFVCMYECTCDINRRKDE